MATDKEIQLVCEIQALCIKINMAGRYSAFSEYSGHVQWFSVSLGGPGDHYGKEVKGWSCNDHVVKLSTNYKPWASEKMKDVIADRVKELDVLKGKLERILEGEPA